MAEKKCNKCGDMRPLECFPRKYRNPDPERDARRGACQSCINARNAKRYREQPEVASKAKASSQAWARKRFTSQYHRELWRAQA